jgi:hypothetical protein
MHKEKVNEKQLKKLAKHGGSCLSSQYDLREVKASLSYIARPCFKTKQKTSKN